jgi:hypothetical protein
LEIAKDTPTGHLRGISAVHGYQGPTEIPAGADAERDLEAEAAAAAKIAAQDAKAGPSSHLTPACPCRVRINSRSNSVRRLDLPPANTLI